jgi:excisionase family DNA binding protein
MNRMTAAQYTTLEVATLLGVTKRCLLNWLRDGKIPEPERDRNQYRVWGQNDLTAALAYKEQCRSPKLWGQHAKNSDSKPEGRDG